VIDTGDRPALPEGGRLSAARMRALVSVVLLCGVIGSAILIALGFATSLIAGWDGSLVGRAAETRPAASFAGLGDALLALQPLAIAQLGLLVLIATPVLRVAISLLSFAAERDWLYVAITGVVLAILLVSLFALG
jgi:uncharacterized membrane protein